MGKPSRPCDADDDGLAGKRILRNNSTLRNLRAVDEWHAPSSRHTGEKDFDAMKASLQHTPANTSRVSAKNSRLGSAPSDYVRAGEVRALLAGSLAARQQRLAAPDMITTDEAAQLVNTTRVTINAWIAKGRAVGLTQSKRGFRMPRWQFEPQMWEALQALSTALGTTEGWALLSFLETPSGALEGLSPRQAIEQGQAARVMALAGHEGN
jgi:hypothetical protein